jgi:hypothetical protein
MGTGPAVTWNGCAKNLLLALLDLAPVRLGPAMGRLGKLWRADALSRPGYQFCAVPLAAAVSSAGVAFRR